MNAGNRQCDACKGKGRVHTIRCTECGGRGHFGRLDPYVRGLILKLDQVQDLIRAEHGIHPKGEALTHFPISSIDEELLVVEADGLGGAHLLMIEGPYPFMENCMEKYNHHFEHEQEACQAAEWLDEHIDDVDLTKFFVALDAGESPHLKEDSQESAADSDEPKEKG